MEMQVTPGTAPFPGESTDTQKRAFDFGHELATHAAQRLLAWFGRSLAEVKNDGSLVTQADLEVDRLIHAMIQDRFPHHGVLSEEIQHAYEGHEYTWVVDPLDGTTNFANGLSHWGTSIALLHHGEPLLAVLDFPLLNQRFCAVRCGGAELNGRRLRVQPPATVHGNQFFTTDSRSYRYLEIRLRAKPRILGAAAYDLAAVAGGMSIACIETTPKVWDLAGAWLVNTEAGAVVGTLFEGPSIFPLRSGQDYGDRVYPLLFAASEELYHEIKNGIRLRTGAGPVARRLEAQGWTVPSEYRE